MSCETNCEQNGCLAESLCENVNSVVTVYTDGACFTGLLVSVSCEAVKLITNSCRSGCPGGSYVNCYGKVTVIPICQINAVTFCNTSV